jgi:hypothetical protein
MKLFGIICFVILLVSYVYAMKEKPVNKSGNGVYYGSAASKVSENWVEYDRENGDDAYINGY